MYVLICLLYVTVSVIGYPSSRIIGSVPATENQFPYMAVINSSFTDFSEYICGGAVISKNSVITAASCFTTFDTPDTLEVILGTTNFEEGVIIGVDEILIFPGYSTYNGSNDLAILRLNKEIKFNNSIQAIELGEVDGESRAIISGYGLLVFIDYPPLEIGTSHLMYANTTTVTAEECVALFGSSATEQYLCTKTVDGKLGGCFGDMGDPVVVDGKLVGVNVANLLPCASGFPDLATRVSHYKDWIEEVINS